MFSLHNKYKIRIVYSSGYIHDFWCYSFKASQDCNTLKWKTIGLSNRPVNIGIDNSIIAIWQIGYRRGIFGDKKK